MKILLFHPTQLPAPRYGGVERVVIWLARGLVERGHEVWAAAYPGSLLPPGVRLLEIDPSNRSAEVLLAKLPAGVELVHFMAPPEKRAQEHLACAQVLTVHGNGKPDEKFPKNTVFLSRDHAERHGSSCFVYNGIDPDEYEFSAHKENWFLFLSKTQWKVKNLSGAVSLCLEAGASLRIAGGSRPYGIRALSALHPRLRWEGAVGGLRKNSLLSQARALVFPVIWPEPFGLAVVEALASGTPVLASPLGSLPELVGPEVGALLDSRDEWIEMLSSPSLRFDPERCRAWVIERFHFRQMALGYENVYKKVINGEVLQ
ncbi:glycosyltransferase [Bdellovibrionota bacterium FG-2]